ncbi:prophage P1 protein 31 [Lactiplantibacillus plantarum]|nr:prophage P1 protein 31 [Lactiplantibacillus plantarum]
MKVYRKTATIKAEQFDGSDEMVDKYELIDAGTMLGTHHSPEVYLTGSGKLCVGDWIATGANGDHWSIADDVFKKTYAELPVIPEEVAYMIKQAKNGDYKLGVALYGAYEGVWQPSVAKWILMHTEVFARAWINGYTVEADK